MAAGSRGRVEEHVDSGRMGSSVETRVSSTPYYLIRSNLEMGMHVYCDISVPSFAGNAGAGHC